MKRLVSLLVILFTLVCCTTGKVKSQTYTSVDAGTDTAEDSGTSDSGS